MKIGIETSTLGKKTTGTNSYLECLLDQLEKTSNDVIRFSPSDAKFKERHLSFLKTRYGKHLYRRFLLKNEIEKSAADCAIFPDYFMPQGFKKPSAIIIHDLSFISHPEFYSKKFTSYYNYQLKLSLKENPVIIAVSEHTKKNIVNYLNVKEDDVKVMQGYSRFYSIKPGSTSRRSDLTPYFLYVGHIEPRKNLKFMIEGFLEWNEHNNVNYKLKIIGELWINSSEIKEILNKYSNHPDINFEGYVSEDKLENAYKYASGFLHTSHEEGFGFPVLEAMHHNLPLLCTKGIATEEISKPFSITFTPNDKLSFYNGLEKLSLMAENNQKVDYQIKYSPELMQKQLNEVLDILDCRVKKIFISNIPSTKSVNEAIIKTLIYSSLFNMGIKRENLRRNLFDVKCNEDELSSALNHLEMTNIAGIENGYVNLKNPEKGFYSRGKKKIDKSKLVKLLKYLEKVPFISSIAFSGGTTHYGLENHDDIDLFIITKPNTVFLVYFMIHLYSIIFKARKELCANYLIDEDELEIKHSFDIYTAHQIISLSAFKNSHILFSFFNKNVWIQNIFPNFDIPVTEYKTPSKIFRIFKPLNLMLLFFYKKLYKDKLLKFEKYNSLILNSHCIKLHTNDHKTKIINEFEKTLDNYRRQNSFGFVKATQKEGSLNNKIFEYNYSEIIS